MREDFLYHIWQFRKFQTESLKTSGGELIDIVHPGIQNDSSGPDFFNAKVYIGKQLWAGNVEIHIKASDWYLHQHETDPNYDNVILHVVWEDDVEIFRKDNSVVPCLELKGLVSSGIILNYSRLLEQKHFKINCERDFGDFSDFQIDHWLERLYFERLEVKSQLINELLFRTGNNWEATLFILLAKSFGLNINGEAFMSIAESFDFKIIQKLGDKQFSIEALLLGQSKLITGVDQYAGALEKEYEYLAAKFSLTNEGVQIPKYFRLRPDNFPVIRLVQLSTLYANQRNLFQKLIVDSRLDEIYKIFDFKVPEYWQHHYNFGKDHRNRKKKLSRAFIDLIIINCIVPLRYNYSKFNGEDSNEILNEIISQLPAERNSITDLFRKLKPEVASNALKTQSLIHLKKNYCDQNKCLYCELGASLLQNSAKYV